jgi:ABC-2 type transport system permease protein
MKKIFFVLITEIKNTVLRPSFIIITFGVPVIASLLLWAFTSASEASQASFTNLIAPSQSIESMGYIDPAGLIDDLPSDLEPAGVTLEEFSDEQAAKVALESGEISVYYLIPEDFLATGEYIVVTPDFNPLSGGDNNWAFEWALTVNLLDGDEEKAARVFYPMIETRVSRSPDQPAADEDNPLTFAVPYVVTIFFYMIIFGSATLMLNSISKEKQNRVIEVLLLSVSPRQLLVGKIVALGLVGMMQTGIYLTIGSVLLRFSGRSFEFAANFNLPENLVLWGLVFFVLGYSIYAALMAGAGALAPNTREASQITFILIIPLIIPLFFMSALIDNPNSLLSILVSMFPFSAPVAMMTRLAAGQVPMWQLLLSTGIMAATAYLIMILVARLFRAQTLLTGQEVKVGVYVKALLSRN